MDVRQEYTDQALIYSFDEGKAETSVGMIVGRIRMAVMMLVQNRVDQVQTGGNEENGYKGQEPAQLFSDLRSSHVQTGFLIDRYDLNFRKIKNIEPRTTLEPFPLGMP